VLDHYGVRRGRCLLCQKCHQFTTFAFKTKSNCKNCKCEAIGHQKISYTLKLAKDLIQVLDHSDIGVEYLKIYTVIAIFKEDCMERLENDLEGTKIKVYV
jgi:hypothetical protein